ncbi:MAG TPA: hypothetical protein PLU30_07405 [Verrucomicrobiae bacterium]|nr:hypothetical protein [Verrucomicrobiae bacterium]
MRARQFLKILPIAAGVMLGTRATVLASSGEFFVLWGDEGKWEGRFEVREGRFESVEPYSFEAPYGDRFGPSDERHVEWSSGTGGQLDGIRFRATVTDRTVFVFKAGRFSREWRPSDFPVGSDAVVFLGGEHEFAVLGRGNPERGPLLPRQLPLPELYRAPKPPADAIFLPGDWSKSDGAAVVRLSEAPPGDVAVRRVANGASRLYLEIWSKAGPMKGRATVEFGGQAVATCGVNGSLWLALRPRIGVLKLSICYPVPGGAAVSRDLGVPASLVETRGRDLLFNGEPFLIKGSLPRGLNDADAAYLKSLGANTIRIRAGDLDWLGRYGFMGIVMVGEWPAQFIVKAKTDQEFLDILNRGLEGHAARVAKTVSEPRALILQHANELTFGVDPWERMTGRNTRERLDYTLATCFNIAEPLEPMLPQGYSNCALTYRTPDFLDAYLHNTYLDRDRGWPPLAEFMRFQGCDRRPFISTEFGANVYMPQAHLAGKNTPVLEKIHAWNYPHRWKGYLGAGACGGTCYCLYDYDYEKFERMLRETPEKLQDAWDKGFTNFGIMTFDRRPKLACWELGRLWRDFEVASAAGGKLLARYVRDYWARDCRLTIRGKGGEEELPQVDFGPMAERLVDTKYDSSEFRWRMDYTTHGGLPMVACGAWPPALEAEDFLKRLEPREGYLFLRELFDAEVVGADGRTGATTLKDLERDDGIVTVVFRKPNGVAYVTALAHRGKGPYAEGVSIELAFRGRAEMVDEMTGKPTGEPLETETVATGMRLKNLRVPLVSPTYTQRSKSPVRMPVVRIEPGG